MDNYLQILEESLLKKRAVLEKIERINDEQEHLLKHEPVSFEAFDRTVDQKGELISILNNLDSGFEQLYENIRMQLQQEKEKYKDEIVRLQKLISQVTEKSVTIQVQEARNKKLVEEYFRHMKKDIHTSRASSKASLDYYRNMNKTAYISPQFMDKKK